MGIRSPKTYYYRFVYADALRAGTGSSGPSSGSGRRENSPSPAAARAAGFRWPLPHCRGDQFWRLPDIPFLCDFRRTSWRFRRRTIPGDRQPLKAFPGQQETVFLLAVISIALNLAPFDRVPDGDLKLPVGRDVCPPSTIFARLQPHRVSGVEKQIEVYPFHKHEIPYDHNETKFRLLMSVMEA